MSQIDLLDKNYIQILPLHFNIAEHYLPLNEFIETAVGAKAIIENFNKEFCGGKLEYRIVVFPPEKGSFKSRLGVWVLAGATSLFAFANTDIGKGFIHGLTDHDPAYWSEQAGISIKNKVQKALKDDSDLAKKAAATVLKECAKGFLQKDSDELRKIGISKRHFREAYEAKNDFYSICLDNQEIKGIGFDDTERFPIKRSDFPKHIVALPPENDDELDPDWIVETKEVKVTSPVWVRDGRQWQAKYDNNKDALFIIEDEGFWKLVEANKLKPKIPDLLLVQWAYVLDGKRRKNVKVLKVLEYNRAVLAKPLTNRQLNKILKKHSVAQDNLQEDLFSRKTG